MEMAAKTWKGGNYWEFGGGGTVWNSIVYDPEFDNVYLGVGNGSPWTEPFVLPVAETTYSCRLSWPWMSIPAK